MRATWVRIDDVPQPARVRPFGIDGFYLDPRDPGTTRARLDELVGDGFQVGIYVAWNWPDVPSNPVGLAAWTHQQVVDLTDGSPTFPRVQFDVELHDPAFVVDLVSSWRVREPARATSWTLEPMQGGWFTPELVATVKRQHVRVSPQTYRGDMTPVPPAAVVADLVGAGVPRTLISPTYDAASLPAGPWRGWAFTQDRLPS